VDIHTVQSYLTDVAHKYGLYKYARFNTTVEEARWNEQTMKWETKVSIGGGKDAEFGGSYTIKSNYLVSGTGQLNAPKPLNVPGIEDYQGKLFHSARWDWSYRMEGKKIAVVGTGSSSRPDFWEVRRSAACR
jgi:cation diffusion facilitator CzcD-associated flavoprotein CzcO